MTQSIDIKHEIDIPSGEHFECGQRPLRSIPRSYPHTTCDGLVAQDDPKCPQDYALCGFDFTTVTNKITGMFKIK
jgi:hypothetical protein